MVPRLARGVWIGGAELAGRSGSANVGERLLKVRHVISPVVVCPKIAPRQRETVTNRAAIHSGIATGEPLKPASQTSARQSVQRPGSRALSAHGRCL